MYIDIYMQILHTNIAYILYGAGSTVQGLTTRGYGHHGQLVTYNDAYIHHRSKMIQWAISARQQHYPGEEPYRYKPLAGEAHRLVWDPALRDDPDTMRVIDATMPIVV